MIKATGIGSVPHKDVNMVCNFILDKFPDIPFWPQLFKVAPTENMFMQFTEKLPCLEPDLGRKTVRINEKNQCEELLTFYNYFDNNCYEYFEISNDYGSGFQALIEIIQEKTHPCAFIKGQVVGPVTFLSAVMGKDNKALIHDDMMSDAILKGLAMKAVWQSKEIEKTGKIPIIFFDEPYLSSFGSAFVPLEQRQVTEMLNRVIRILTERTNARTGIHCCGNTDWPMLLNTDVDILSFDAYGFGKCFTLYPDDIRKFLHRGGVVAWGVVPTAEYRPSTSLNEIKKRFSMCLWDLSLKGIDAEMLLYQSLITPACGSGLMCEADATRVLQLTSEVSADLLPGASVLKTWAQPEL